jgi:hypothetical protein
MKLDIHPEAALHFNEGGLSIVASCKENKLWQRHQAETCQFPDVHVSRVKTLTSEDIVGEIERGVVDEAGEQIAKYFTYQGREIGLEEKDYEQFIRLCESIQKAIKPFLSVSRTAVEKQVFAWIRDHFCGNTDATLIAYILPKLETEVAELEVWVPIAQLRVESSILIGKIVIRPISEELINQWRDIFFSEIPDEKKANIPDLFEQRLKKEFQGWSAGVITLAAEPKAAEDLAIHETERSLAILSMFSTAALTPKATCYAAVMGRENIESINAFTFKDGVFSGLSWRQVDKSQTIWNLDNATVADARKAGLDILSELLSRAKPTEFQKTVLASVLLYAKATRATELSNKLVYLLASLEGMFLKDENEPIQQNLGERIATLIGTNLENKKGIIKNIKAIYGLRSAFLHHAHTIDNRNELEMFMRNAWRATMSAAGKHDSFTTRQDFASAIDDRKLSPS